MTPPVVLTVAAHDPLGGAGVAADLTTFAALGMHGVVALTAVTAQRFASVDRVEPVSALMLAAQLDGIIADCRPAAMKVGLLLDAEQVRVIAERVADGRLPFPVVDPVMVDGRGQRFVSADVERACRELLYPLTDVLTPNRAEASLLGASPESLARLGPKLVVVTGGGVDATDLVIPAEGDAFELGGEWIDTRNDRGSGCTFAAAIAVGLAAGHSRIAAVEKAKVFVTARLRDGADSTIGPVGAVGPVSHRMTSHPD